MLDLVPPVRWHANNFPLCTTPGVDSVNHWSFTKIHGSENVRFDWDAYFSSLSTDPSLLLRMRNESKAGNHTCLPPASLGSAIGLTEMTATLTLPYLPWITGSYSFPFLHCLRTILTMFSAHIPCSMMIFFFYCKNIIFDPFYIVTPSEAGTVYRLNSTAPGTDYRLNKHSLNEWVWHRDICHINELRDSRTFALKHPHVAGICQIREVCCPDQLPNSFLARRKWPGVRKIIFLLI